MRVEVTCPRCGHSWLSQSLTGKTRCGECRQQVYIPADIRNHAHQTRQPARFNPTPPHRNHHDHEPAEHNLHANCPSPRHRRPRRPGGPRRHHGRYPAFSASSGSQSPRPPEKEPHSSPAATR